MAVASSSLHSSIRSLRVGVPVFVMAILKKHKIEQAKYKLSIGDQWIETLDEEGKPLNFVYTQENGKQMYIDTPSKRFVKLIEDYNKLVDTDEEKLPRITLHGLRHPYVKHTTKKYIPAKAEIPNYQRLLIVWGFCFHILFYNLADNV